MVDFSKLRHPAWAGAVLSLVLAVGSTFSPQLIRVVLLVPAVLAATWTFYQTEYGARNGKKTTLAGVVFAIMALGIFAGGRVLDAKAGGSEQQQEKPKQPDIQQNSSGSNSPNTSIAGDNNTVINNSTDPKVLARLNEIKELIKAQQGDHADAKQLLQRYPLGYMIYDIDYTNGVLPYKNEVFNAFDIDWTTAQIKEVGKDKVSIGTPNITGKGKYSGMRFININTTATKKVGPFDSVKYLFAYDDIGLGGEILAISSKGVVVVLGFSKVK